MMERHIFKNQPKRLKSPTGHEAAGGKSTGRGAYVPLVHESVASIFTRNPICANEKTSLGNVIQIMQDRKIGAVLIESEGKLKGLFSERDLIEKVLGESVSLETPIGELTTSDPVYLQMTDEVGKAIRLMADKRLRHLPVCGDEMEIVGILSVRRIIDSLADQFPAEVINRPPRADQSMRTPEGG